jgi:hypothetical protein
MALEMLVLKPLMSSMMGGISGMGMSMPMMVPTVGISRAVDGARGGGRSTTTGITNNMGAMTINVGGERDPGVEANERRTAAFGRRVKDLIQGEMIRQSRPGGLLYGR